MCHERERLIGYIYDECSPQERVQIDAHLTGCSTCREELGGLRQVRQDLLAWDVPEHGSVWRPFAPPRPRLSWQDVPAWVMAAAAGVVFLAGAAGGVATQAWFPAQAQAATVDAKASAPARVSGLTAAELTAVEARVAERVRAELVSRSVSASPVVDRASDARKVEERVAALEREYFDWKDDQLQLNALFAMDIAQVKRGRAVSQDARTDVGRVVPAANFTR